MARDIQPHHDEVDASSIKFLRIVGNSMAPDLMPGSSVAVDTADRIPSPPGLFAVWDGMAVVAKIIEAVPSRGLMRVRIKSRNPDYEAYETGIGTANIQGRIIGYWQPL